MTKFLALAVLLSAGAQGAPARPSLMTPLRQLAVDGGLYLDVAVDIEPLASGRMLQLFLRHQLIQDFRGRFGSSWSVSGASGYVLQDKDGNWTGQLPGFRARKLKARRAGDIIATRGQSILKQRDPDTQVLAIGAAAVFFFDHYLLASWREGAVIYRVELNGAKLREIAWKTKDGPSKIEYQYCPSGDLKTIVSPSRRIDFSYADPTGGQLTSVEVTLAAGDRQRHEFHYREGLLDRMSLNGDRLGEYGWRSPSLFAPVQLKRPTLRTDGIYDYDYSASRGVVTMIARERRSGKTERSTYNVFLQTRENRVEGEEP